MVRVRYTRERTRVCAEVRIIKQLIVNRFVDTMHAQFLFEISKSIASCLGSGVWGLWQRIEFQNTFLLVLLLLLLIFHSQFRFVIFLLIVFLDACVCVCLLFPLSTYQFSLFLYFNDLFTHHNALSWPSYLSIFNCAWWYDGWRIVYTAISSLSIEHWAWIRSGTNNTTRNWPSELWSEREKNPDKIKLNARRQELHWKITKQILNKWNKNADRRRQRGWHWWNSEWKRERHTHIY